MKKFIFVALSLILLSATNSTGAEQDPQSNFSDDVNTFISTYLEDKVSIGARITHRTLTDSDSGHEGGLRGSGTYLGTIWAIDEVQNYMPHIFVDYSVNERWSIELAYDYIEGETLATSIQEPQTGTKSDGNVSLSGFTISLLGRYPNQTKFTPYGGIGIGYYRGDFEETAHWGLGYYSEEHYIREGSTGLPYEGRTKSMSVENSFAFLVTLGTRYALPYNCYLDASVQYVKVEADVNYQPTEWGVDLSYSRDGIFPLDNIAVKLGIAYML